MSLLLTAVGWSSLLVYSHWGCCLVLLPTELHSAVLFAAAHCCWLVQLDSVLSLLGLLSGVASH